MSKPIMVSESMIVDMFGGHPDLDLDRDCVVLNLEDIRELRWLDAEIGLEHLAGKRAEELGVEDFVKLTRVSV
jgi:hypothetical protein